MVGQTVGKYRIVSRLGRGGMGTVYQAVDQTLDRDVAIKCLNAEISDPDLLKRFRAEAITLARLNHPNIATLFDLGEYDGHPMMVMEFVRGETFDRVSQREGPMGVARAAQLCAQALDALEHAHRAGVVHRDLKPANLMLTQAGLVKVMDFGLARIIGTEHLTHDGFMVGTPAYMSPEQVLGKDIDGRADLYAMGVVLFRLLTSQLPFKADSSVAMVQRQLHDTPTPVRQVRSELPEACDEILTRALDKVPAKRFQTADEFRSALTRLDPNLLSSSAAARIISSVAPAPVTPAPGSTSAVDPSPATLVLPRDGERSPSQEEILASPEAARLAAALSYTRPGRARLTPVAIAAGVALLAGIPVTGALWWRAYRSSPPPSVPPAAAVTPLAPSPSSASTPAAAPPSAMAATTSAKPAVESKTTDVVPVPKKPAAKAAVATAPAPAPVRSDLPVAIFSRVKLLILGEERPRELDATLRLASDGFEVLDGSRALESAWWEDVIGLYYSHSKEPRWTNADGVSAEIARASRGGLGFLKGTPDWITVRTRRNFVSLRVREEDVSRVRAAIEARSGEKIVTAR